MGTSEETLQCSRNAPKLGLKAIVYHIFWRFLAMHAFTCFLHAHRAPQTPLLAIRRMPAAPWTRRRITFQPRAWVWIITSNVKNVRVRFWLAEIHQLLQSLVVLANNTIEHAKFEHGDSKGEKRAAG